MLVVFARESDHTAQNLVRRWADRGAVLMTPRDLSRAGWYCTSSSTADWRCVLGGAEHEVSEISGVLMRWAAVLASDLPHIQPANRTYVAAEMNAFLIYWLNVLDCPVLNRPTPRSLCGPGWYPEHWMNQASRIGMRVRTVERSISQTCIQPPAWPPHGGPFLELTIVGQSCFGTASRGLVSKALALAKLAGTDLVRFRFDKDAVDACFLEADLFPPLSDEAVERAVLTYLSKGRRGAAPTN